VAGRLSARPFHVTLLEAVRLDLKSEVEELESLGMAVQGP
jgi:hypothetical protein